MNPEYIYERAEEYKLLHDALYEVSNKFTGVGYDYITRLTDREILIINWIFFHDKSKAEISTATKLTIGRIWQIEQNALHKIRCEYVRLLNRNRTGNRLEEFRFGRNEQTHYRFSHKYSRIKWKMAQP